VPAFQSVLGALTSIGYYSLNLDRARELQNPDTGTLLNRDGSNLASVIRHTGERSSATLMRMTEYLVSR